MTLEHLEVLKLSLRMLMVALIVRMLGAIALGDGAPFGPDGTGAEAAVALGGHPYPLHIMMLSLFGGDARGLSILCGSLNCVLIGLWGHRVGLGMRGGWLAVVAPLSVLPGVLSAGDAPAMTVALLGILLSTVGGWWAALGGVLASLCVAAKPVVLPVFVLLLARPVSLVGASVMLLALRQFVAPLWNPMPQGGLLGTWWISSGGHPPAEVLSWAWEGLVRLLEVPAWAQIWWVFFGALAAIRLKPRFLIWAGIGGVLAVWFTAALFGGRLEARYLSAALIASLPFVGFGLRRPWLLVPACAVMLWSTTALVTQLSASRARLDRYALVPDVPVLDWPAVEADAIFRACSTEDATRLRRLAQQLAEVAPAGSTIVTEPRHDGREGELFWPLRVLRPDLKMHASATAESGSQEH